MISNIDIKYFKMVVSDIGRETQYDIVARCPICGDSSQNKNMKRLHLYNKNDKTFINCFNGDCPCKNKSMYSFLKLFSPNLLESYKKETFGNFFNKKEDVFLDLIKSDIKTFDFTPLWKDISNCSEFLSKRKIVWDQSFGNWYYSENNMIIDEIFYKTENSIIIPLYNKINQIYGFYSRNISDKKFATFLFNENIGYKIWNWFKIDKSMPVYIFEGIFDAISSGLKNVIALMGSKIPQERLSELSKPIFILDNDKTGFINSLTYCKDYYVFIQPEHLLYKDMNELRQNESINIIEMIKNNLFTGISAEVRLKRKLS